MRLKKQKGAINGIIMGVIVALMILFVGVFMIDKVSSVIPEGSLYNYSYTSITNSSSGNLHVNTTQTHVAVTGAFVSDNITDYSPISSLSVTVENRGATSGTVNATVNGVSLGTFSAPPSANTSNTFIDVGFKASTNNNLTFGVNLAGPTYNISVNSSVATYASGRNNTWAGTTFTSLNTNTGTIFDVLILVIIVAALGVAIFAIRGFAGGRESVSSGSAF